MPVPCSTVHAELGDTVVVIGAGGVGLNVIQAARLSGASQIIAIDRVASKERMAVEFGATDFILAEGDDFDSIAAVQQTSTSGVDHAFEVVGSTKLLADAISMVRPGEHLCRRGPRPDCDGDLSVPGPAPEQEPPGHPGRWRPAQGGLSVDRRPLPEGHIPTRRAGVQHRRPGRTQGAFDALKAGAEARTVLLPTADRPIRPTTRIVQESPCHA